jgi:hypothetical protein
VEIADTDDHSEIGDVPALVISAIAASDHRRSAPESVGRRLLTETRSGRTIFFNADC